MKKGYTKIIWIIGTLVLLIILALIITYAITKNYKEIKNKPIDQPPTPVVPLIPGFLKIPKRKKGEIKILIYLLIAVIIIAVLTALLITTKEQGEETTNLSITSPQKEVDCVKQCINAENYQECIDGCKK